MKSTYLLIFFWCISQFIFAQEKKYLLYLKDKKDNGYNIKNPESFLTQKALERRKKQNISIEEQDLPVSNLYIENIKRTGAKIWYTSRWLNAIMVEADDKTLENIKKLNFILPNITYLSPAKFSYKEAEKFESIPLKPLQNSLEIKSDEDYGISINQIKMIGANKMHADGHRGKNMVIAVFDSGFLNANKIEPLSHLFKNQQILGTFDFVLNKKDVYTGGEHGLNVLSTIASFDKDLIGTAPEAHFYLFRTEDANSEYRVEEFNWLVAAEKADSLGVDVINSSLGYNDFNDNTMNYTHKNLDGKTSICSKAATIAAKKGILVVSSAGNEGNDDWQKISMPADADLILTVGAVNEDGDYASFSSLGPTADNRQKPNVMAQGAPSVVASSSGKIKRNSGTSFSSPIIAGFAASFWGAFPKLKNQEVIEILEKSASQSQNPDNKLGYGIPNYEKAKKLAQEKLKSK
jgi:subtilisin family serine protease